MTARLDIIVGEVKNAMCVPIAALKTDNQGSYVEKITHDEKMKSDVAERVYVSAGFYGEECVEITVKKGTLLDGDEVSVSYEAEAKKAATQNMPRRMGPPM